MEGPPSSECATTIGSDNDRESVRHGVRMDEEWEHQ